MSYSITTTLLTALAAAMMSVAPAAQTPALATPSACAVLDPSTIKQTLGVEAEAGKPGTSYFAGNTNCQFKLAGGALLSVIVTTSAVQPTAFKPSGTSDQRFKGAAPLSGVGDRAFIWPASANEGVVEFLKGNTEVDLRVSNFQKVLTPVQLTALAKAALAKL